MKNEILVTGPMYPPTLEKLDATYTTHKLFKAPDRGAMLAEVGERITAVASSNSGGIDGATISKLPKLKVISHFGVGYDTVDVPAAKARGITVTNTPDVLTEEVADLAMGLLYATVRRIPQGDRYVRDGKWLKGGPGTYVFGPREIPHGFKVIGTKPARMLLMATPGKFDGFILEQRQDIATPPSPPDMAKVMSVAAKYQIDILGPLPEER